MAGAKLKNMKFSEIFTKGTPVYSLEFFPPKKEEALPATYELVKRLSKLQPDFMTVTYGAGGNTQERTNDITGYINRETDIPAVSHLTCVGHSVSEIDRILDNLKSLGISHILALRGDPPQGEECFEAHPEGFSCARDLVRHIAKRGCFSIAVAGYPEGHPEAKSKQEELSYLKEKVEAGAEIVITQLFFDVNFYFDFVAAARAEGISVPIVPGLMPIRNVKQLERFTAMCGASIPEKVRKDLSLLCSEDDIKAYGVRLTIKLAQKLLEGGAPGIHLFTLNKSKQVEAVLKAL